MILVLDVGNTRVKWARADGGQLAGHGVLVHRGDPLWQMPLESEQEPSAVYAVSVAGAGVNARVAQQIHARWGLRVNFFDGTTPAAGMRNGYCEPGKLGPDRWAAVVAAHRASGAACILDCGSAVTVDTVSADGNYLGGMILPGLAMMRRALRQDTALLPEVELGPVDVFARDTVSGIRSGTLLGLAAMLDGLIYTVGARLGRAPRVFLTGGDAPELAAHLRAEVTVAADLVLEGVALLAAERA